MFILKLFNNEINNSSKNEHNELENMAEEILVTSK